MRSLLKVNNVKSGYGNTEIIHGVSIEVTPKEIVTMIGPNGSGKSTLMKTIFGLLRLTSGQIFFNGEPIHGLPPDRIIKKGMCYVPQTDNVFSSLSVIENLRMGAFIRKDDISQSVSEVIEQFPMIGERKNQKAGSLSGGERQMLAIARTLMLDPKLIMLDEPTANLAPKMVKSITDMIGKLRQVGIAFLIIEQRAELALRASDRGYILNQGQIFLHGRSEDLLEKEEVVELYLGR